MKLVKKTVEYRVESEESAVDLINTFKEKQNTEGYEVIKSGYTMKTKKAKGVVVDCWFIVSITMNFDLDAMEE